MKKITLITAMIICSSLYIFGQSKKKIVNEEIKTKIEWKYIISGSDEKKIKKKVTKFDNKGNVIELIQYDNDGKLKKRKTQKYNKNNDVIVKISYLSNGKINKKTVYEYENDLKKSKAEYNGKGKLISKKEYEYLRE